ncbi:CAMK/CAMKL/KIN4 protein kinase [Gaeumannomyces tritici R3-111a-1]|uniref:non-specific serine/threonine protein kinase n=1 Tax=Gaeumannomyces tritici (strain R3-111a-1) TaxID=644352 RepID=J3NRY4_GAET3|nr:CAMK/CAMKL/KIN4 protein kinase [Gaeumannomyces tritici R3-111a-1]EJT78940.1 CAMK/CAMKL/KIN4 protein kinase [Gaeumannomyces tritici R3-111a-1]
MSSAAIHAAPQALAPALNTPPLVTASSSGRHAYASSAHSSPTREGYHANPQHSNSPSQRQSRRTTAAADPSASSHQNSASPVSQSNSPMSSRAAISSPVAVATGTPEYQTAAAAERRRHHAPSNVPPRTSSSHQPSASGQSSRRSAAANERAHNSPRRAPDNRSSSADQLQSPHGEQSPASSRRKERQHYVPAPPNDARRGGSSSRDPRASAPATTMPIRTQTTASSSAASSSRGPSREASEILHSMIISPPEVDIDREKERLAQAQPHPLASAHGVDDAATPPVVSPAEARGTRSRHDHSKREKQTKFGDYILGNTIGEGEFGKVKLGWKQEGGVQVAIKLIKKDALGSNPSRMNKIMREVQILKQLTHPNIVRLHRMEESERHYGIILEYASGGELFDYILNNRYLKDNAARRLFAQLVSGVGYLHKKGIVHRDLKLENLLLDRNRNIIITDFGFANMFDPVEELTEDEEAGLSDKEFVKRMGLDKIGSNNSRKGDLMLTSCGSPCYAAPELVVSDSLYTGRKVDVWSCGVILYAMLAGYLPFDDDPANPEGDNINLLYKYIVNTPLTFPEYVTPHAKDLLRRILVPNPRRRADLFEVARHSWLSEYAHAVEFITSSTTTHTDIQNTTVPAEDVEENGGIVRSASVRESSRKTPVSTAVGGLATKQGGIDQDVEHARQQKDNKRRTVQVEYVAPTTQTQRGEPSNAQSTPKTKTRARSGSEGPVEVVSTSPNDKPLPKDPPVTRDSYVRMSSKGDPRKPPSSHRNQPMTTRPPVSSRVGPEGAYMTGAGPARPNTSGSVASNGSRVPGAGSRSSYGQPLPPAVAGTNAHGRIQQPVSSGKPYVASPLSPDGQHLEYGRPSVSVPSKFAKVSGFSGDGEHAEGSGGGAKSGHRRSNTLGEITGKMFGRSGSLFGNKNRKKTEQQQQQPPPSQHSHQAEPKGNRRYPPVSMMSNTVPSTPGLEYESRQSLDSRRSRRSFSFGLGKKRSGSVAGSQTSLDKQTKRFSFIPNSISLKAIGLGKDVPPPADESQNDLPIQEPPMVGQHGRYVDQRLGSSHNVNAVAIDDMYAQLSDPQHAAVTAGSALSLSGPTSAQHQRYPSGQYDGRQQKPSAVPGYLQRPGAGFDSGSESSVNDPRAGRMPPGSSSSFQQHQRPQDQYSLNSEQAGFSQSASNVRGGRGMLQKPKRFVDAYDTDENSTRAHDHGGSSGAARRVMDFFRRRGKARGGDER